MTAVLSALSILFVAVFSAMLAVALAEAIDAYARRR